MENQPSHRREQQSREISSPLIALFAAAVGIVVLALYASQPLVGIIGPEIGLSENMSGLTTTLTLSGYATGLFLLVPLTDIFENKKIILATLTGNAIALLIVASAPTGVIFLIASFFVGLLASAIQMLVPVAASLSSESLRGGTIGNVMSGLMLGILFSRPIASIITQFWGWRYLYGLLGLAVASLTVILYRFIPQLRPHGVTSYWNLLGTLISILKDEPTLRRRAASQAMCMGAFGVFWTSIALRLAQVPFSLGQEGIAIFSLAGAAGAIIAPIAGRAGDRGLTYPMTVLAHTAIMVAMALACIGGTAFANSKNLSLAALL